MEAHFAGRDVGCVRGENVVFVGLDFALGPGDALVLVGPNGSGKSSLLRVMAGLLPAAKGRLEWDGADISHDGGEHGARLQFVGHLDAVKPVLSVAENLRFWAALLGGGAGVDIGAALDALEIGGLADVPGRFLSAGQKRRANLARLGLGFHPLWLLDEPTTALDVASIRLLDAMIKRHRDAGGIVVLSTHADIRAEGAKTLDLGQFSAEAAP